MGDLNIFGLRIDKVNFSEAVEIIKEYLNTEGFKKIYTPNPEIIMGAKKSQELTKLINQGDLITADGIGVVYASKILKNPLEERVTGYDLSIEMLRLADKDSLGLYLIGGKPGIVDRAKTRLEKDYPHIKNLGTHHGYFPGTHLDQSESVEQREILEEIKTLRPDIIFVGMGFPIQEKFIDYISKELSNGVAIGNGGVIDILAGEAERAPEVWQKLNLEWLYRLIKNPRRIKRQILLPKFIIDILLERK